MCTRIICRTRYSSTARRARRVARHYPAWFKRGIHVVTPNKKANSADWEFYQSLQEARRLSRAHYLYETTVGAGLPVIQTLRDLRETGDDVASIEGIFSGTLAYLFNVYDGRRHSPRSCARRGSAATPSPIRATICPASMWRASSSSSGARWACRSR